MVEVASALLMVALYILIAGSSDIVLWGKAPEYPSPPTRPEDPPPFVPTTGTLGETATALRPVGKVCVDGQLFDGRTQGEYIDVGRTVAVLGARGVELLVCERGNDA